MTDLNHPLSIDVLKFKYPKTFNFVKDEVLKCNKKNIIVKAPVKSGKRVMVEIGSLMTKDIYTNIFLTSHLTRDKSQHEELKKYGLSIYELKTKRSVFDLEKAYKGIDRTKPIIFHIDELDYGASDKNLLYKTVCDIIKPEIEKHVKSKVIYYSATPDVIHEENIANGDSYLKNNSENLTFVPSDNYIGIGELLRQNRIKEAEEFILEKKDENGDFSYHLSEFGKERMKELLQGGEKFVSILRLTGKFKESGESKFETCKKYYSDIFKDYISNNNGGDIYMKKPIFVSSKNEDHVIKWYDKDEWIGVDPNYKKLYILNETSKRSIEFKCQPVLVWYYTYRGTKTPINTIVQDQERVVYYEDNHWLNNCTFTIYGNVEVGKYSADQLSFDQLNIRREKHTCTVHKKRASHTVKSEVFNSFDEVNDFCRRNQFLNLSTYKVDPKNHEQNILKRTMKLKNENVTLSDEVWNRYRHREGFYTNNHHSSRRDIIKNNAYGNLFMTEEELRSPSIGGINERQRKRLFIFYDEHETNPLNFKYLLKYYQNSENSFSVKKNTSYAGIV
jgi:hypothetical protein